jgi:hypothetical protein
MGAIERGIGVIKPETDKIDQAPVDGLLGTPGSLAAEIQEIEIHLHSCESWFEVALTPNGEIHVADRIGSGGGRFRVDAGNDAWGDWKLILGSSDTPARIGMVKFDLHRIVVAAAEKATDYFIQIAFGETGAIALNNNHYTDLVFVPQSVQGKAAPFETKSGRWMAGTKTWVRCKAPGQNTSHFDFYFGLHEYPG